MEKKTALQQLKEFMHQWTSLDGQRLVCTVDYLKEKIDELVATEKQHITEAYQSGQYAESSNLTDAEQYYNETFNK